MTNGAWDKSIERNQVLSAMPDISGPSVALQSFGEGNL